MLEDKVMKNLQRLPMDKQQEILDFTEFLVKKQTGMVAKAAQISWEEFTAFLQKQDWGKRTKEEIDQQIQQERQSWA